MVNTRWRQWQHSSRNKWMCGPIYRHRYRQDMHMGDSTRAHYLHFSAFVFHIINLYMCNVKYVVAYLPYLPTKKGVATLLIIHLLSPGIIAKFYGRSTIGKCEPSSVNVVPRESPVTPDWNGLFSQNFHASTFCLSHSLSHGFALGSMTVHFWRCQGMLLCAWKILHRTSGLNYCG